MSRWEVVWILGSAWLSLERGRGSGRKSSLSSLDIVKSLFITAARDGAQKQKRKRKQQEQEETVKKKVKKKWLKKRNVSYVIRRWESENISSLRCLFFGFHCWKKRRKKKDDHRWHTSSRVIIHQEKNQTTNLMERRRRRRWWRTTERKRQFLEQTPSWYSHH